jgi:F-type H+-transporting ATPase subunit c
MAAFGTAFTPTPGVSLSWAADAANTTTKQTHNTMFEMFNLLAEITGSLPVALAALSIPLCIAFIGYKACEAVGRNPGASTKILIQSIIAMALAEAIIFFVIFLA